MMTIFFFYVCLNPNDTKDKKIYSRNSRGQNASRHVVMYLQVTVSATFWQKYVMSVRHALIIAKWASSRENLSSGFADR